MSNAAERNIDLMIAGRSYSIRVQRKDELNIRKIADEINTKVKDLQVAYTSKDKQDCLSIALLTYAVDNFKLRQASAIEQEQQAERSQHLQDLSALIEESL